MIYPVDLITIKYNNCYICNIERRRNIPVTAESENYGIWYIFIL